MEYKIETEISHAQDRELVYIAAVSPTLTLFLVGVKKKQSKYIISSISPKKNIVRR